MGLFSKKKETTHFKRDEEGRVTQVTHNGQHVDPSELKMKTGRQLEQEYYRKHPEKRHPTLRKIGAGMERLDNRTRNIMAPQRTKQTRQARPVSGFVFSPPSRSNANPFGSMFDSGLPKQRKPKKKTSKTKYTIISGKAYPIAGIGQRKTKKKKSTRHRQKLNDPFDFSGWL